MNFDHFLDLGCWLCWPGIALCTSKQANAHNLMSKVDINAHVLLRLFANMLYTCGKYTHAAWRGSTLLMLFYDDVSGKCRVGCFSMRAKSLISKKQISTGLRKMIKCICSGEK